MLKLSRLYHDDNDNDEDIVDVVKEVVPPKRSSLMSRNNLNSFSLYDKKPESNPPPTLNSIVSNTNNNSNSSLNLDNFGTSGLKKKLPPLSSPRKFQTSSSSNKNDDMVPREKYEKLKDQLQEWYENANMTKEKLDDLKRDTDITIRKLTNRVKNLEEENKELEDYKTELTKRYGHLQIEMRELKTSMKKKRDI